MHIKYMLPWTVHQFYCQEVVSMISINNCSENEHTNSTLKDFILVFDQLPTEQLNLHYDTYKIL